MCNNNPPKVGKCYCGCGKKTKGYFVSSHDRKAESF